MSQSRIKIIAILGLSILISLITYKYLKSIKDEIVVYVANEDIAERTWVKPEMLQQVRIRKKDKQTLAPNAVISFNNDELAVANTRISKGSIINADHLIMGSEQSLASMGVVNTDGKINTDYFIPQNMRVLTVRVDSQGATSGKINTGDFIDVVLTGTNSASENFSSTILQNIEVYDVEKSDEKSSDVQESISLLVTPQQAVELTFAKRTGKIDLVLNPSKAKKEPVTTVYTKDVEKRSN